ncbi:MAG: LysR family transcriptional regulator [Coriobacteriia bacterium]|nr:LysR family transcriptional regulator [Coriobacteriia bacterium]
MIMMNNNLRVFVEAAERSSFTRAAEALHVTQPAVSRAVRALEDELKVKLFFRDKRTGLALTDVGEKVLALARQMADTENRIYQAAFRENNFLGGRVRVASMPVLTSSILSKALRRFRDRHPYVSVELVEGSASEIRRAVEDHRVDFGFTLSPFGGLDSRAVFTDRMLAVGSEEFDDPEPVDVRARGFVVCKAGYETMVDALGASWEGAGDCLVVQQAETVIGLVREGNGVGVISELVLNATPNRLCRHAIEPAIELEAGIVANDLDDLTPVAIALERTVLEACEEYCEDGGGQRSGHTRSEASRR